MTIDDIRTNGKLLFEYKRGSHLYNLNTETSDEDYGGVYVCDKEELLGLRSEYVPQVSDDRHDCVYYEFGRWFELLLKSNPTALESLFIPENCIIGKPNKIIEKIISERDMFVSKDCFKSFYGYAVSQIEKARGLNKKIVQPILERKNVLDFCHVFRKQGSTSIANWLEHRGLKQQYCGLVNIPNMYNCYGVYYDWGNHFINEGITIEVFKQRYLDSDVMTNFIVEKFGSYFHELGDIEEWYNKHIKPFGYSGIVGVDVESTSVRLSSVGKHEKPICYMNYNKDGFVSHCRKYAEYKDWEKNRNKTRYESNLNKNYDSKNMMHCMRLIRMAKELAMGLGFNVVRTYDRELLLDIKNHKFEYDEIMEMLTSEQHEMEEAIKNTKIKEHVDFESVNKLLIESRKKLYNI